MKHLLSLILCFLAQALAAQDWTLKLSSNVELRTWTLTSKAEKREKTIQGANIKLFKGESVIGETTSDPNGDFVIDIPAHGDFLLAISYPGCNTKKFYVTTNGVPENVGKDNYKPTVMIGGFIMSKPITGVDYIGLNEPLVKVEYKAGGQNFDKDETVTNQGLNILSKISASENSIIEKFCNNNKLGDEALRKKKCELAKEYYTKARAILPDEQYPINQLLQVEQCLDEKKVQQEIAAEEAAKKAEAVKLAQEKAIAEKNARANASFNKTPKATPTKTTATAEIKKTSAPASTTTITASDNPPVKSNNEGKGGNSKYKMPQKLGVDEYKETISHADNYFKNKRYKEAKSAYEKALKLKVNDTYATDRITQCDKILHAPDPSKQHK